MVFRCALRPNRVWETHEEARAALVVLIMPNMYTDFGIDIK